MVMTVGSRSIKYGSYLVVLLNFPDSHKSTHLMEAPVSSRLSFFISLVSLKLGESFPRSNCHAAFQSVIDRA